MLDVCWKKQRNERGDKRKEAERRTNSGEIASLGDLR